MHKFKDKIVWISGASSGIGEATAYQLAAESATLILTVGKVEMENGYLGRS